MKKLEKQFNYIKEQSWFLEFVHYIEHSEVYQSTNASIIDLIVWGKTDDHFTWAVRDDKLDDVYSSNEKILIDDVKELIKKARRDNIELFI